MEQSDTLTCILKKIERWEARVWELKKTAQNHDGIVRLQLYAQADTMRECANEIRGILRLCMSDFENGSNEHDCEI